MSVAARIVLKKKERAFDAWLYQPLYDGFDLVPTYIWFESLIEYTILTIKNKNYVFSVPSHTVINKILNHTHTFEKMYIKYHGGHFGPVHNGQPHRDEDYDYFFTRQFPPDFWEHLRKLFAIEWFADGGDFSDRLWIELPFWVAQYIDFKNSVEVIPDNVEEEALSDNEHRVVKKGVDPYVQDYYGNW